MIFADNDDSQVVLGVRSAKATLDRIGIKLQALTREQAHRAQCALELARDALTIVGLLARGRTSDAVALADKLARAAAEFSAALR